ncbi:MAG TPA: S-adenosylmethionine decarboxylase [Pyrinomonadaceae bacterium]|jgi:S-adenosylmethionine decarboxylase|nr:S-adenosylmethionine decarboxylase [Pyrinomonadaceae bacterium]
MSFVGTEWLVDAAGCRAEVLSDMGRMRAVFARVVSELSLHVLGDEQWHKFPEPGGGITGLAMLTESHLACHTYPESGIATFNLYCCRARPGWPWAERLAEMLGANSVTVRVLERHGGASLPNLAATHEEGREEGDEEAEREGALALLSAPGGRTL